MIVPVTNMLLARILAPTAFGIVATVNMIISFIDMITTAGFQRYLVQHECKDIEELYNSASVAFWTNLALSFFLGLIAVIFVKNITILVGSPGYENAVIVACISLPITSFSSVQEALYRRSFDYKTLFVNRMIATILPFVVTIPLALMGIGYWALIIGTIAGNLAKSINLTIQSPWKPNMYYSVALFKDMISFGMWALFETFANWATFWIDILIISNYLGVYYTGVYRTSQVTVSSIIAIITSTTTTVLFSSLSRMQTNMADFSETFLKFQKRVSVLVLPMGVGMFMFSSLITRILLGNQWTEASSFIGIWGLCSALVAVYGAFCREAYISIGKPKLSLFVLLLHLGFVIPICIFSVKYGYQYLIYVRSLAYLQIIVIHLVFMKIYIKISPLQIFKNTCGPLICSILMAGVIYYLKPYSQNLIEDFLIILLCIIFYLAALTLSPIYRKLFTDIFRNHISCRYFQLLHRFSEKKKIVARIQKF